LTKSIAVGFTGINADGQSVLKETAERLDLGDKKDDMDVYRVGEEIASIMHEHALDRNSRVLGALFIAAGLDSEANPRLLLVDPSGSLYDYKVALGGNAWPSPIYPPTVEAASRSTGKAWGSMIDAVDGKDLTLDEAVKAAISASLLGDADPENLMVDVLDLKTKTFRELGIDEKRRYM
jgi:20S proteasome alpha/beta subunit